MNGLKLSFALLALAMVGCDRDIEAICEDFVDECGEGNLVGQCVERGEAIEQEALAVGCDNDFRRYLECVDDTSFLCSTEDACGFEREILEDCGVVFSELD